MYVMALQREFLIVLQDEGLLQMAERLHAERHLNESQRLARIHELSDSFPTPPSSIDHFLVTIDNVMNEICSDTFPKVRL